jgi:hypothetical protein
MYVAFFTTAKKLWSYYAMILSSSVSRHIDLCD